MNHAATHFCMCMCVFWYVSDVREIGDVDEGVVEGGEDACDAEDEFACGIEGQFGVRYSAVRLWWCADLL